MGWGGIGGIQRKEVGKGAGVGWGGIGGIQREGVGKGAGGGVR